MTLKYNHKEPCDCINCDGVRAEAFHGPGLYRAKGKGTTTWKYGLFMWDVTLPAGTLFYVVRELRPDEKGMKGESVVGVIMDGVEDRWLKGPVTCTNKKWLEPA